jgi:hypothetical protein
MQNLSKKFLLRFNPQYTFIYCSKIHSLNTCVRESKSLTTILYTSYITCHVNYLNHCNYCLHVYTNSVSHLSQRRSGS